MAWQRERFRVHIRASRETGLPLVIHTRSASDDTLAILREEGADNGVFHCFTESDTVRACRARPRLPHLVLRHPDFQDRTGAA